ncbi:hypothetical protein HNP40_004049 [Mycobacteroides chelonae]|nr:hypothetical protein [Mycobacteroides chelonae]
MLVTQPIIVFAAAAVLDITGTLIPLYGAAITYAPRSA